MKRRRSPAVPPRSRVLAVLAAVVMVLAACSSDGAGTAEEAEVAPSDGPAAVESFAGTEPAPEFPDGLEWLNTERPLALRELRGKVVLLDFWTYGCINCIHIIPDLELLEEEFADELVVIGVHSAKFDNEAETENIRQVVVRYDLEHPVVNDADFRVWRQWGAQAWPTVVVIDPSGNIVGEHRGEGVYRVLQPVIASLVDEFDARGQIDRAPLDLALERDRMPESVLSYPGKVLADPARDRLFIADTNHHRIVVADPETGEVLDVAGIGTPGFRSGPFTEAQFDQPQGMALSADGTVLYVADVGNHSIRAVDFSTRSVSTLVGTGSQPLGYPPPAGTAPTVALNSPWALERDGALLYIAMAGSHQVWVSDLLGGATFPVAGSGREGTEDGAAGAATLAQPSGLALADGTLYFADSESSTIRYVDLGEATTGLLAGSGDGLFDFGDVDGFGSDARLQHPLGVAFDGTHLYVADTYNSKIKQIDPATGETTTLLGGEAGWRDGADPRFYEPGGLDIVGRTLYVADTNNHAIRTVDLDTGEVSTLVLYGIERFTFAADGYTGKTVTLDPIAVAPGEGTVVVDVALPDGYKVNDIAPFSMAWTVEGDVADLAGADRSITAPEFPIEIDAEFREGRGEVTAELTVYYCDAAAEQLCLIERVRLTAPLDVGSGGPAATLTYAIPPPPLLP